MPRKLLAALLAEGHEVASVKSLQLQGIDNGDSMNSRRLITIFALLVMPNSQNEFSRNPLRD
jgi:hypothetical protein